MTRNSKNPVFPDRKSLVDFGVSLCRKWKTEPTRKGVSDALSDEFDEKYELGRRKGGTYFTEAADRIVEWSDESSNKWARYVADVLREYQRQGGPRVAKSKTAYSFNVGDVILYGKYKNKKGVIKSFGSDAKGNPTITIEPIPKGRKQDKTMGLFKVWKMPTETAKKVAALYREQR
jgi:hypothetical protein